MSPPPGLGAGDPAPRVLVADDDLRVLELITVALTSQGFEVLTAVDGEEALRLALGQRPDLLLLEERLPRRGGLEVCEFLRRDPEEGAVPIVLMSAVPDPDTRARALARGADDLVAKPFSPRDLVARVRRLIARALELREARRRARHLERELHRAQDEARRVALETRRERRIRDTALGLGRELHRALDPGGVADVLLAATRDRLRCGFAALLVADAAWERVVPFAVAGDGWERVAGLDAPIGGELVTLLGGLARPALRRDLERFPELRHELSPFVACGVRLLAPVTGPEGVEAVLLADERPDGQPFDPAEIEALGTACEVAGLALLNGRRVRAQLERALGLLAGAEAAGPAAQARSEAATLCGHAAEALLVPARLRVAIGHAIALARWADTPEGLHALGRLVEADVTGLVSAVARVLARAEGRGRAAASDEPDLDRAALLARIGARYAAARAAGYPAGSALDVACGECADALDAASEQALRAAARELDALGALGGRAA